MDRIRAICVIGGVAGILAAWVTLRGAGVGFSTVLSFRGLLETGNQVSITRYSSDALPGEQLSAALLALSYAACICAAFLAAGGPATRWYRAAPFVGILAYSFVSTARLPILIGGALMLSSAMAVRVQKTAGPSKIPTAAVVKGTAAIALIAALFSIIAFVRVGEVSAAVRPVIVEKLQVYALGYLSGYSQWFDEESASGSPSEPLGLGAATVAGAAIVTGGDRDAARAYGQFQTVSTGSVTNIYTVLRGLIADFGRVGALSILFLVGIVTSRLYEVSKYTQGLSATFLLAVAYSTISLSNTMSIVSFTNVCAGLVLAYLLLQLRARPPGRSQRHGEQQSWAAPRHSTVTIQPLVRDA